MTDDSNAEQKLDFSEREVVLRADFEQLDEQQCVWTSLRFMLQGPRHPREGEWVYLIDTPWSRLPGADRDHQWLEREGSAGLGLLDATG